MGLLDTNSDGLAQLAAHCRSQAEVLAGAPADAVSAGFPATAAAVNDANAETARASQVMAARMHDTAAQLATAAAHFATTDRQSAARLRELVPEV